MSQRDVARALCQRSAEAGREQLHPWAELLQLRDQHPARGRERGG